MSTEKPVTEHTTRKSKPVFVYIMVLFIAAFLLMALSFAMHQRSNTEAMGQLQTSIHATMEDIQDAQLKITELEKELVQTTEALEDAEAKASDSEARLDAAEIDLEAILSLYAVQQKYSAGDYEGCALLIEEMESSGLADLLPSAQMSTSAGSVTAPSVRFQQFKYAVQEKLPQQATAAE